MVAWRGRRLRRNTSEEAPEKQVIQLYCDGISTLESLGPRRTQFIDARRNRPLLLRPAPAKAALSCATVKMSTADMLSAMPLPWDAKEAQVCGNYAMAMAIAEASPMAKLAKLAPEARPAARMDQRASIPALYFSLPLSPRPAPRTRSQPRRRPACSHPPHVMRSSQADQRAAVPADRPGEARAQPRPQG
eukprot:COSAG04_NODE_1317_length_7248_cov_10.699119_8_plen_190_part_00